MLIDIFNFVQNEMCFWTFLTVKNFRNAKKSQKKSIQSSPRNTCSQIQTVFVFASVWLGLRSGAAKVRQSCCVRPPESSSSSSTQYRVEIVLWNWFCSRLDLRPRQKQNGKKDKYTNTKTNTLHCALCSRLTRERLLSDRPCCKIKTIVIEISNERFGCSTGRNTNTVGVLNGK